MARLAGLNKLISNGYNNTLTVLFIMLPLITTFNYNLAFITNYFRVKFLVTVTARFQLMENISISIRGGYTVIYDVFLVPTCFIKTKFLYSKNATDNKVIASVFYLVFS